MMIPKFYYSAVMAQLNQIQQDGFLESEFIKIIKEI